MSMFNDLFRDGLGITDGNRETDALRSPRLGLNGGVDANQMAVCVNQRAA